MAGQKPHIVDTSRSALGLPDDASDKKVEKIASGKAKKKTKSEMFAETFLGGDIKSIGQDIVSSIVIPAMKNTVSDLVHSVGDILTGGADRILYGGSETYVRGSQSNRRPYVSYDRSSKNRDRASSATSLSRRELSTHARRDRIKYQIRGRVRAGWYGGFD